MVWASSSAIRMWPSLSACWRWVSSCSRVVWIRKLRRSNLSPRKVWYWLRSGCWPRLLSRAGLSIGYLVYLANMLRWLSRNLYCWRRSCPLRTQPRFSPSCAVKGFIWKSVCVLPWSWRVVVMTRWLICLPCFWSLTYKAEVWIFGRPGYPWSFNYRWELSPVSYWGDWLCWLSIRSI